MNIVKMKTMELWMNLGYLAIITLITCVPKVLMRMMMILMRKICVVFVEEELNTVKNEHLNKPSLKSYGIIHFI